MKKPESYASVWDAIADTPGEAANLRARAELMQQIAAFVKRQDWTQVEAASHCGVTHPRINDLLRRPRLALLAGRAGEYLDRAGLPRAGRSRRRLRHAGTTGEGTLFGPHAAGGRMARCGQREPQKTG